MRQYAQEIGDRFAAALAHSYGDAYTFLRSRSNVARWSPEQIVVLRDRVEHAYQAGRLSGETLEKACQLIASLAGNDNDPKTDEIAIAPRAGRTLQGQGRINGIAHTEPARSVLDAIRNPLPAVSAVARETAPETVLLSPAASPPAPAIAPSPPPVTASPCRVVSGSTLGQRYVLERLIGIGGTAVVYRARDLKAPAGHAAQRLAVKILHPALQARPQAVERFVDQFRRHQKLSHAGIARVFDLDVDAGTWFMTMELLEGETLRDRSRHNLSHSEALRLLVACGDALGYAHRCGVVHGDLKPSNIFLTHSGAVRLLDFGGSAEPRSTGSAVDEASDACIAATPAYASPEVLAGERPEVRDDVFSLACIAHELLTGQPRGATDSAQVSSRTAGVALSLRDSLALSRGMAWQRFDRPASVAEFLNLLVAPPASSQPASHPVVSHPVVTHPLVSQAAPVAHSVDTAAATVSTQWQRHWRVLGFGLWGVGCLVALFSFAFSDPEPLRPAEGARTAVTAPQIVAPATAAVPSAATRSAAQPAPSPPDVPVPTTTSIPVEPKVTPPRPSAKVAPSAAATARRVTAARAPSAGTANDVAAVTIGLERRQVLVSSRAVAAVITLKRIGSTSGRARVRWSTVSGTAKSAQDFRGASAIAEFADGQEIRTLFVPIMQQPSERSRRTFSIALARAPGGPPIGPVTSTTVTILDDI